MTNKSKYISAGASTTTVLVIVFLVLKLVDVIDWRWVWIFSPWWIELAICGAVLVIAGIVFLIWLFFFS